MVEALRQCLSLAMKLLDVSILNAMAIPVFRLMNGAAIDALTVVVARADSNISRTMTAQRVVYQGPQAKRATNRERPFCIFASKNVT